MQGFGRGGTNLLLPVLPLLSVLPVGLVDLGSETGLRRETTNPKNQPPISSRHPVSSSFSPPRVDLETHPHEPVLGLKLLLRLLIIVNQSKPSRPPTSKLGLESKRADSALVSLVQGGELFVELGFGDGGSGGVEDVDDELSSVEESVGDELAGSDGDRAGGILARRAARVLVRTTREVGVATGSGGSEMGRQRDGCGRAIYHGRAR